MAEHQQNIRLSDEELRSGGLPRLGATRRSTLPQEIVRQLVALIEQGHFVPGSKLPTERQLMERLQVSRSAVREAMQALVAMRLVDIRPGRGAVLLPLPVWLAGSSPSGAHGTLLETIHDLYDFRLVAEVGVAALVIERATPEDIERLDQTLARHEEASATGNLDSIGAADLSFHCALAAAAHSPTALTVISALVQQLLALDRELQKLVSSADGRGIPAMVVGRPEHRTICACVRARDADGAGRAVRDHLWHAVRDIDEFWDALNASAVTVPNKQGPTKVAAPRPLTDPAEALAGPPLVDDASRPDDPDTRSLLSMP
jgi:GntR family transcriptional regulator, sialic acid-inducible nan operon repressor